MAMHHPYKIEGKLTKKQEETLRKINQVRMAFYDMKTCKLQPRTMKELRQLTGLSTGFLSIYVRKLVEQNIIVSGELVVRENKLKYLLRCNDTAPFYIKGKEHEKIQEVDRIYYTDNEKTR